MQPTRIWFLLKKTDLFFARLGSLLFCLEFTCTFLTMSGQALLLFSACMPRTPAAAWLLHNCSMHVQGQRSGSCTIATHACPKAGAGISTIAAAAQRSAASVRCELRLLLPSAPCAWLHPALACRALPSPCCPLACTAHGSCHG